MEKRVWTMPQATVENFEVTEYIAACWDIHCNVPSGTGYYETNGIEGYQEGGYDYVDGDWVYVEGDDYIARGWGCNTVHEASGIDAAGPAANAKWEDNRGNVYDVFYFKANGYGSSNHHFCTLDAVNWKPNPNAS